KFRWEGVDGSALDALGARPLDATRGENFLGYAGRLAATMDRDHVATLCFVRFPGQSSIGYDDLRRGASFTRALGQFVTLDEYFATSTAAMSVTLAYEPDRYVSPFLPQAVEAGASQPISCEVPLRRAAAARTACETLRTLSQVLT